MHLGIISLYVITFAAPVSEDQLHYLIIHLFLLLLFFTAGPINFSDPIKAVPSAPNFNLLRNKAAALSLPEVPLNFQEMCCTKCFVLITIIFTKYFT